MKISAGVSGLAIAAALTALGLTAPDQAVAAHRGHRAHAHASHPAPPADPLRPARYVLDRQPGRISLLEDHTRKTANGVMVRVQTLYAPPSPLQSLVTPAFVDMELEVDCHGGRTRIREIVGYDANFEQVSVIKEIRAWKLASPGGPWTRMGFAFACKGVRPARLRAPHKTLPELREAYFGTIGAAPG
jgi:hypothetical protein